MPRDSRGRGLPRNSNSSQLTTSSRFGTSRSSSSSKRSTKSNLEGSAELEILEIVDEINVLRFRGVQGRALHADTRARWGAAAPHRASSTYMYIDKSARIRASCIGAISHISNKAHTKLVRVLRMNLALFGAPATIRPTNGLSPTLPDNSNCTKGSILPDYLRHLPQGDGKYFATRISLSIMRTYHQSR